MEVNFGIVFFLTVSSRKKNYKLFSFRNKLLAQICFQHGNTQGHCVSKVSSFRLKGEKKTTSTFFFFLELQENEANSGSALPRQRCQSIICPKALPSRTKDHKHENTISSHWA